jgi:long-chain acyl-CoA synthetase
LDPIHQVFVVGDSLQSYVIAVVVPDAESAVRWWNERQVSKAGAGSGTSGGAAVFPEGQPGEDAAVSIQGRALPLTKDSSGRTVLPPALAQDSSFLSAVMKDIERVSRENGLKGFEIPRKVHIEPLPFDVESGKMTASMKPKRHVLRVCYDPQIKALYGSESS